MKGRFLAGRQHIDKEKVAAKAKAKADLNNLLDVGDETGYVEYLKLLKPNMAPEELQHFIELFRAERRRRAIDR
jgi:hypothetical protein